MDIGSRVLALPAILVVIVGTFIGSVLPELGNVLAIRLKWNPHIFNGAFLAVGGIIIVLALFLGFKNSR